MKKYSLPREFAEKWVEALKSGGYEQTQRVLRERRLDGSYCYCGNGLAYEANGYEFANNTQIICNGKNYSGFVSHGILPIKETLFDEVINLNDNRNLSFAQLADWITENVNFI